MRPANCTCVVATFGWQWSSGYAYPPLVYPSWCTHSWYTCRPQYANPPPEGNWEQSYQPRRRDLEPGISTPPEGAWDQTYPPPEGIWDQAYPPYPLEGTWERVYG